MMALGSSTADGKVWLPSAISDPTGTRGDIFIAGNVYDRQDHSSSQTSFVQVVSTLLNQVRPPSTFSIASANSQFVTGVDQTGRFVGFAGGQGFAGRVGGAFTVLQGSYHDHAVPLAINSVGVIAGYTPLSFGISRAAIWNAQTGAVEELGLSEYSRAYSLNNLNTVVGDSRFDESTEEHAFVYRNGQLSQIAANLELGKGSVAYHINNKGQILGAVERVASGGSGQLILDSFMYSDSGGAVSLVDLGLRSGYGHQTMNDQGQILLEGDLYNPTGTLSWARTGGGNAAVPGNWDSSLGFAPNRFLDVVVGTFRDQTVTVDSFLEAKSLHITGSKAGRATLQLSGGAIVNALEGVSIEARGRLQGAGRVIGPVVLNYGTVTALPGQLLTLDGGLDNRGLVTGTGRIEANLINRSTGGGVRVGAEQNLTLAGTVHSASDGSHITIQDGGRLAFEGRFVNQGGAFLDIERGTLQVGYGTQRMDNGGLVRVGSGRAEILGDVNNSPRGLIHAHDGADLTVWDALRNDGELRVSGGSTIVYAGPVSGKGGFTGLDGMHRFEGGYSPGNSPAAVQMGNVQIASLLTMELGGLAAASQYDHIDFVGSVLFEATSFLKISLINGFTPHADDHFALFSYAQTPVGNFEDFYLPSLNAGLNWDVSQLHTTGNLLVSGVPEPHSWALMLVGLLGVFSVRSRCLRSAFFDTQLESPTMKFSPAMLGAGLLTALIATMPAQSAPVSGRGDWETTLSGRDLDGNLGNGFEAYYDTSLNITWLATAQAPGGNLSWVAANAWAASLNEGGVTGWRLPGLSPAGDGLCHFANVGTDCGYNVNTADSEIAHLFHISLGNRSALTPAGGVALGAGLGNTGPFSNVFSGDYWTAQRYAGAPDEQAWFFNTNAGLQMNSNQTFTLAAWAVRDGDVGAASSVPEPQALKLALLGLLGLGLQRHLKRGR